MKALRKVSLVVACLACAGNARRVQSGSKELSSRKSLGADVDEVHSLAGLLLGFNPTGTWSQSSASVPRRQQPEIRQGRNVLMQAASDSEKSEAQKEWEADDARRAAETEALIQKAEAKKWSLKNVKAWWDDPNNNDALFLKDFIPTFLFFLLIRFTIVEPRFIPSESMVPTFQIGDQFFSEKVSKYQHPPVRHDVVIFEPPERFWQMEGRDKNSDVLVKRVVAVAGDTVEVKGGKVYINGEMQDEPYTNEDAEYTLEAITVPEGSVFVLGDNRNKSFDSHFWGFLPVENVIGNAWFRYWPPWKVGGPKSWFAS